MPYAAGVYTVPPGTEATTLTPIDSSDFNAFVSDIEAAQNAVRPVVAGGTGVTSLADLKTALSLGTASSPEFLALNIGHASDTTLTRVSAGVVAIEGQNILTAATGQALNANLTALTTAFTAASASGPASLAFAEDTDNGTNKVTLKPAASLGSDIDVVLPSTAGTLALVGQAADFQEFNASGTWTKPSLGSYAFVQCWAGGGSGGRAGTSQGGGAGGGGGYNEAWFKLSDLSSTETVTVGAGGAAVTVNDTNGNPGGNSTFGSRLTAYRGGGGANDTVSGGGGGGGGTGAVGANAATTDAGANGGADDLAGSGGAGGAAGAPGVAGGSSVYGGGGGGGAANAGSSVAGAGGASRFGGGGGGGGSSSGSSNGGAGGASVYGGGGGGGSAGGSGTAGAGGASKFGGAGGAGAKDASAATAGSQPGGGGGGSETGNSGAGGDGRIRVTVI